MEESPVGYGCGTVLQNIRTVLAKVGNLLLFMRDLSLENGKTKMFLAVQLTFVKEKVKRYAPTGAKTSLLTLTTTVELTAPLPVGIRAILSVHIYAVFGVNCCILHVYASVMRITGCEGVDFAGQSGKRVRHLEKTPRQPKKICCLGIFTRCLSVRNGCGKCVF